MSRRDVVVPAHLLLHYGLYAWPLMKIHGFRFAQDHAHEVFLSAFKEGAYSQDDQDAIKTTLGLEIVVTTLHYAETLASYLLAFEKGGRAIQRSLFHYRVSDVDAFYKNIAGDRVSHIAKMFSYPQPHQFDAPEVGATIRKSCHKIKNDLTEVGAYYLEHKDLYNSYKHGMRVGQMAAEGADPNTYHNVITYFTPDKAYYPSSVVMELLDYKKAQSLSEKIAKLLTIAVDQFRQRVVENRTEIGVRPY